VSPDGFDLPTNLKLDDKLIEATVALGNFKSKQEAANLTEQHAAAGRDTKMGSKTGHPKFDSASLMTLPGGGVIGRHHLEDDPVLAVAILFRQCQLRITDALHCDDTRSPKDRTTIACYWNTFLPNQDLGFSAPGCTGAAPIARAILLAG
jgi:hypothetical protein